MPSRRALLAAVLGGALAALPAPAGAGGDGGGLNRIAAHSRRRFGTCLRARSIGDDPALCDVIRRECGAITPELELKWAALEPERGRHSFAAMDRIAAFARGSGIALHGHALLWHRSVPGWAEAALQAPDGWAVIRSHFQAVTRRYGRQIGSWDVVNEPIDIGHRDDGLRPSRFLTAFGPDYIARAFHEARRLAPRATLLLNEYGLEYEIDEERQRRHAFLRLLERLRAADVPIDAVGLQGHLDLAKGGLKAATIDALLRDIAGMGLAIHITELDVKEHDYTLPREERDTRVADEARRYLDIVLAHDAVRGVSTWGLSDRQSWLEVTAADYSRFPGAWQDGTSPGLNRGLPYDAALGAKRMYLQIDAAFRAAAAGRGG